MASRGERSPGGCTAGAPKATMPCSAGSDEVRTHQQVNIAPNRHGQQRRLRLRRMEQAVWRTFQRGVDVDISPCSSLADVDQADRGAEGLRRLLAFRRQAAVVECRAGRSAVLLADRQVVDHGPARAVTSCSGGGQWWRATSGVCQCGMPARIYVPWVENTDGVSGDDQRRN